MPKKVHIVSTLLCIVVLTSFFLTEAFSAYISYAQQTGFVLPWNESAAVTTDDLQPPATPVLTTKSLGPVLEAKSALAIDLDSGVTLFQHNQYERLPIASLTKLMTVLITLDLAADVDSTITIPAEVTKIEPSKIYLRPGDVLTVRQLILAALIHSANDAAYVLSTLDPQFIEKMNQKALELGLEDTHFTNAIGWDEPGNYSSAYDLSKLMRFALEQPLIANAISTQALSITSQKKITYDLKSTNQLWGSFLREVGGKTGTTDEAGPSFINIFQTARGHRVLTVLLNSPSRFQETKVLSYWVTQNFEWR